MRFFYVVDETTKTKVAVGSLTVITAVSCAVATFDDARSRERLWEAPTGKIHMTDSVSTKTTAWTAGGTATLVSVETERIVGQAFSALDDAPFKFYD